MYEKQTQPLGRGRGRAEADIPVPQDDADNAQCSRRKHSGSEAEKGSATGSKRGMMRDNRPVPDVYTTKPASVENSKMGTSGTKIALKANYFPFRKRVSFELSQYRVDFSPDIELTGTRKFLLYQRKSVLGGYIYDGASGLYLSKKLDTNPFEYTERTKEDVIIKITIKATDNVIRMTDGMGTQILNLILRRSMGGLKLQLVKRDYYDALNKVVLKDCNLELWPGYVTSIRQHENNILLCCEISHKIMRNETALNILSKCLRENSSNYKEMFMKEMIGTTVLTGYNNKTYRVDDVDWGTSPENSFETKNGKITFIEYYLKSYQIQIKDKRQPMLISKANARSIRNGEVELLALVPELCRVTGLTDAMRNDFRMMRSLSDHTRINPDKRIQRLLDFNKRLQTSKESAQVLEEWNMKLDPNLVEFTGRLLQQESILFGNNVSHMNDERVDWTSRLKSGPMYEAIPLKRWAVMYPKRNEQESEDFVRCLIDVGNGMKYEISNPKRIVLQDDRTDTYVRALQDLINMDPKLIMCIVSNNKADRYSAIKRLCCINHAIPTQVVLAKTITPKKPGGVMSIASKVVIQLNCKLGGAPWMVSIPLKGLMTVGFDVTHDTGDRSKSYGAFIASMDLKERVKFYSAVSAHKNGEEMSNNITLHLVKALRVYREQNGAMPKKILIYRDGVGDGQIEYVHQKEVAMINTKLYEAYSACNSEPPGMAFIIVSKRLNTRFFTARAGNPVPGTIVDNTVTLPERYDFFLVSQTVRQGTASPTSYNVIFDTMGLPPDKLQILSYKLCHLYFNWSGTTRVPAVVQYAHKLAILVGQYLHQSPSNLLDKQLYFL